MNPILQNILAIIAGIIVGGTVNMAIIMLGPSVIPYPEGVDNTTTEGLAATIHLFETKNFIVPFVAHALGTLIGVFVAAKIAKTHKMKIAYGMGAWFLLGGIMAVYMLPAPMWYNVVDLTLAYIPMAYLGGKMALKKAN